MKYQPGKGVKFITYAAYWIKQAIFRYNENCPGSVRVPEYMKNNIRKYERFRNEYKNRNSKYPNEEELIKELGMSRRSLAHLEKTVYNMRAVSLDAPATGDDPETSFLDYLQSDESIGEAVTYSVYISGLKKELDSALEPLDFMTREMIFSVYYQGNSRAKTAEIFGCSRQNVNERIGKGFYRILHSRHRERLEEYMGDGYRYKEHALCVGMPYLLSKGKEKPMAVQVLEDYQFLNRCPAAGTAILFPPKLRRDAVKCRQATIAYMEWFNKCILLYAGFCSGSRSGLNQRRGEMLHKAFIHGGRPAESLAVEYGCSLGTIYNDLSINGERLEELLNSV